MEWGWQYVFPAARPSIDPRSGARRRHHLGETMMQDGLAKALEQCCIHKHAGNHSLRQVYCTELAVQPLEPIASRLPLH